MNQLKIWWIVVTWQIYQTTRLKSRLMVTNRQAQFRNHSGYGLSQKGNESMATLQCNVVAQSLSHTQNDPSNWDRDTQFHATQLLVNSMLMVLVFFLPGVMEYCQSESFRPTCPDGHVIVIRSARYGRLRKGRCLSQNFGYVGCTNDVMSVMSAACSGRRRCEVIIDEAVFHIERPCHKDLKSYLEVSYDCVPG